VRVKSNLGHDVTTAAAAEEKGEGGTAGPFSVSLGGGVFTAALSSSISWDDVPSHKEARASIFPQGKKTEKVTVDLYGQADIGVNAAASITTGLGTVACSSKGEAYVIGKVTLNLWIGAVEQ